MTCPLSLVSTHYRSAYSRAYRPSPNQTSWKTLNGRHATQPLSSCQTGPQKQPRHSKGDIRIPGENKSRSRKSSVSCSDGRLAEGETTDHRPARGRGRESTPQRRCRPWVPRCAGRSHPGSSRRSSNGCPTGAGKRRWISAMHGTRLPATNAADGAYDLETHLHWRRLVSSPAEWPRARSASELIGVQVNRPRHGEPAAGHAARAPRASAHQLPGSDGHRPRSRSAVCWRASIIP